MKRILRCSLSVLLIALMLFSAISCGQDKKTDQTPQSDNGNSQQGASSADEPFVSVLRFAVVSDIHLLDTESMGDVAPARIRALFDSAYRYSAADTSHSTLDALLVAGDFTDDGEVAQMNEFFRVVNEEKKAETTVLVTMGNHEFYPASGEEQNMLNASGYSSVDLHKVIGGYHFIGISPDDNDGRSFSRNKVNWLEAELKKASDDDPTGLKPIFVFQHQPITNTVYGSSVWAGHPELDAAMADYPQVVDFAGHSHYPNNDPRSIYQKNYTLIGTGTLRYFGVDVAGIDSGMIAYPTNRVGGWDYIYKNSKGVISDVITESGEKNAAQYTIIEADEQNRLRVIRYDLFTDAVIGEPVIIDSIGLKSQFSFTDQRFSESEAPYFATDAKLTVSEIAAGYVKISIPQAICKDTVQNYRCELYEGNKKIRTIYRLSDYFFFPQPETILAPFGGLEAGTKYTVKVFPVNCFRKAGQPISIEFTTPEATLVNGVPAADIFCAKFNDNGSAIDTVSGEVLRKAGSPTTAYDATLEQNVGVFNGSSGYHFLGIQDYYEVLNNSMTLEAYVKLDSLPTSTVDILSNQQFAGFGLECRPGGDLAFYVKINTNAEWKTPHSTISAGEYVHLVATFDGQFVRLYVNGELVDFCKQAGTIREPHAFAHYLCVGGDSSWDTNGECYMKGSIAIANVYSAALNKEQVLARYNTIR